MNNNKMKQEPGKIETGKGGDTTFSVNLGAILAQNREEIVNKSVEQIKNQLVQGLEWQASEQAKKVVEEFLEEQVMPQVVARLKQDQDKIVEAIHGSVASVVNELGLAMVKKVHEKLGQGWELNKVLKALFD